MLLEVPSFVAGVHVWLTHTGTIILGAITIFMFVYSWFEHGERVKAGIRKDAGYYGVGTILSLAFGFWFWIAFVAFSVAGLAVWIHDIKKEKKDV